MPVWLIVIEVVVPVTVLVCEVPSGKVSTKVWDVLSGELSAMAVALVKVPPGVAKLRRRQWTRINLRRLRAVLVAVFPGLENELAG